MRRDVLIKHLQIERKRGGPSSTLYQRLARDLCGRPLRTPGPACSLSQEGEQNTVEQELVNTQQSWPNLPEEREDKGLVMRQPS
ncbi:unnamed protein product [Boreogadus saida]